MAIINKIDTINSTITLTNLTHDTLINAKFLENPYAFLSF